MNSPPKGWVECLLPEIAYFQEGPGLRKYQYRDTGIPFLNIRTLQNGRVNKTLCTNLDEKEVSIKYKHFLLQADDIVCSTSGTLGKTAVIHDEDLPLMLNTSIVRFRPKGTSYLNRRFLHNYLMSELFLEQARTASTGSAQANIGPSHLKNFRFALPPFNEQKRIADKLDTLFKRVTACQERLDRVPLLLKKFRQAVLAAATSGALTEDWRDSDFTWSRQPLRNLLGDIRYGTAKKCSYESSNGTPVLRIPNIVNGKIDTTDLKYARFEKKELETLSLKPNDLLIIRSNGSLDLVGKAAVIGPEVQGYLFAGYLIRLRTKPAIIDSNYLQFYLSSPAIRQHIEITARSTSGVNNINSEEIKAIDVLLPDLKEQQEIVRRVEKLFDFADKLEVRHATALKQVVNLTPSLLAKAFRGELVEQDPNDEPASVLLERIRTEKSAQGKPHRTTTRRKEEKVYAPAPDPLPMAAESVSAYEANIPQRILAAMKPKQVYSRADLLAATGISEGDWLWVIRQLKNEGLVIQTGERRAAKYQKH